MSEFYKTTLSEVVF